MAHVKSVQKQNFLCSFCAAEEAIAEGLSTSTAASDNTYWTIWYAFCANRSLNPLLLSYNYPIPILSTSATDYRHGGISSSGNNVFSCMVKEAARSIFQAISSLGAKDPRLNSEGAMDICLKFQYRSYYKQDPPPPTISNLSQSRSSATLIPLQMPPPKSSWKQCHT